MGVRRRKPLTALDWRATYAPEARKGRGVSEADVAHAVAHPVQITAGGPNCKRRIDLETARRLRDQLAAIIEAAERAAQPPAQIDPNDPRR